MPFCEYCGRAMKAIHEEVYECPKCHFRFAGGEPTGYFPSWTYEKSINLSRSVEDCPADSSIRKMKWFGKKLIILCAHQGGLYCKEGKIVENITPFGIKDNYFHDLACERHGTRLVSDRNCPLIYRINEDLSVERVFENRVARAAALDIDDAGELFIGESELLLCQISKCEPGKPINTSLQLKRPVRKISGIIVGALNQALNCLYLLDRDQKSVFRYRTDGAYQWEVREKEGAHWEPLCIGRPAGAEWLSVVSLISNHKSKLVVFDGKANQEMTSITLDRMSPSCITFDDEMNAYIGDSVAPIIHFLKAKRPQNNMNEDFSEWKERTEDK